MSQHREQHIHLFSEFCRGIRKCSMGAEQGLGFGASAIEHDQRVPMLLQIRRHAASHYSQTNESNFHSCFLPPAVTNSGSFSFLLSFDLCDFHQWPQIRSFQSRSQPETPTLLRQSLEMRRGERGYPYTAFGSS